MKQKDLPYFVDFKYVPEGIRVNGIKYPITRMEWVEGVSLREFIEQNLQTPHIFKVVADEFKKMVAALHKHEIAHGDLQDGNILLKRSSNGIEIKLIDYDSLFVPTLRGQLDEIRGLPEYQHPKRIGGGQANKKVDYFSELVIYLSFLGLSEKPDLWTQFADENRVDRGLLFSKKDFEDPDQSDAFQELEQLSPNIQQLATTLKDFCTKTSIDQLARLEAILANTHCHQGESFLSDERYDEALAEFQKAIDSEPDHARVYFGRGHVYQRTKRYTNAITAFQQAIQLKPNYKEAYHELGTAYFKSGDNSKAEAAAQKALRIDPHYQPALDLLDVIETSSTPPVTSPPTTNPTSTSTSPTSSSTPSQPTRSHPLPDVIRHITKVLRNHWQSVAMAILGLALVIYFIPHLIQMNTENKIHLDEITKLKNQLNQKESKTRELTSLVQTLESDKKKLSRENDRLREDLEDLRAVPNTIPRDVINQLQQLSETEAALASSVNKNQTLQSQLKKKDAEIRQLQNDLTITRNKNRGLQNQTDGSNSGIINQNDTVQRLEKEKTKVFNENRRLQDENQDLVRQNQRLRNENETLQRRLDNTKQNSSNQAKKLPSDSEDEPQPTIQPQTENLIPELPKKVQEDRTVRPVDISRNNQGCFAFKVGDYDKAINQFEQAIKADSKFAVAHYNLGCAYFAIKEHEKALSSLDKAIILRGKFKEAYYNRSLVYFKLKRFQEAKQNAQQALSIDSTYHLAEELLTAIENTQ